MRTTAKQVWEQAELGQAFACKFIPERDYDDEPAVIWVKGDVDSLDFDSIIWIAPIEVGERVWK